MSEVRISVSPHNYVQNNPIARIDPTGMIDEPVYDSDGNYRGDTKEGFTGQVLIYDGDKDFSQMSASELLREEGTNTFDQLRSDYFNVRNDFFTKNVMSKIWTDLVSRYEGDIYGLKFNLNEIENGKIQKASSAGGGAGWYSQPNILNSDFQDGIFGTAVYEYETTVENVVNSVLFHEWYSHIKLGISDSKANHRFAYINEISSDLWTKTTTSYKRFSIVKFNNYYTIETGNSMLPIQYSVIDLKYNYDNFKFRPIQNKYGKR